MSTFLYSAYYYGMLGTSEIPSLLLNYNIQVVFPDRKFDFCDNISSMSLVPALTIDRSENLGLIQIKEHTISATRDHHSDIILNIIDIISSGMYAFLYVDYFFIPGSSAYLKRYFRHEILIVGINFDQQIFHAMIYAQTGAFRRIEVPFDILAYAFTCKDGVKNSRIYCRNPILKSLKPINQSKESLDMESIECQLQAYLDSSLTKFGNNPDSDISRWIDFDIKRNGSGVFGLAIYSRLSEYFSAIAAAGAFVDMRITRLLWEHKKLMQLRLNRLISNKVISGTDITERMNYIVSRSMRIHLMVFAALTNKKSIAVDSDLFSIRDVEKTLLESVLKQLRYALTKRPWENF